jgi:S1-C subfamily serine protease
MTIPTVYTYRTRQNGIMQDGITTRYAMRTSYIPYSVDIYDYTAVYAVRQAPARLGLLTVAAPDSYKRQLGINNGLLVTSVHSDGPARGAGILRGDIIVSVNGAPANADDGWFAALLYDENNTVEIVRDGAPMAIKIFLPPREF